VQWADWSPDGSNVLVVRDFGGMNRLEYPIGKPLYQTAGWIGHPRVSPKGDFIAFADHPLQGDDSGGLSVVDLTGHEKKLSEQWFTIQGLAWSPDGKEIWFTASKSGTDRTLYATTLDGKMRTIARLPGALMLYDIARDGRVLLVRASWRRELIDFGAEGKQHELSWLDYSYPAELSSDGRTLLFDEEGGGDRSLIPSLVVIPMVFTSARPTARRRFCWARAAHSLFLLTENGQSRKTRSRQPS
jgi:eukaryotic-like serine/threonine-protein kinase